MAPAAKKRKTNKPSSVEKYLCFSCDTERLSKQFPDHNPASECEHLINTCKACLKTWVEVQIESANFVKTGGEDVKKVEHSVVSDTTEDSEDDESGKNGKKGGVFGIRCPQCEEGVMKNVNVEMAVSKKVYQRLVRPIATAHSVGSLS